MSSVRIALHVITMNRQAGMERLLAATRGWFDRVRVCDGGSDDDTVRVCKAYGAKVYRRRWDDDMSAQHNLLLRKARKGEWILIMDDDECPSPQLLNALRRYAEESADGERYRIVKIPSIMAIDGVMDWTVDELMAAINSGEQSDRFCKENFFLYDGNVRFSGNSHYGLAWTMTQGWRRREMVPEPYIHYKSPVDIIICDLQQAFINPAMQGVSDSDAATLLAMFDRIGIHGSNDMLRYLRGGMISDELKAFFIKRRSPSLGSVARFFQYYFLVLHPNEMPEWLTSRVRYDAAVHRHLRELGGYKSIAAREEIDGEEGYWLPIADLRIHPALRQMLGTDVINLERYDE